jgi:hypothetical protein
MEPQKIFKFRTTPIFGGSFLSVDTIEIKNNSITLKRNGLFSKVYFKVTFPISNIVNVSITKTNRGADILIQSHTRSQIESKGYRYSSASKIKSLILNELHKHHYSN